MHCVDGRWQLFVDGNKWMKVMKVDGWMDGWMEECEEEEKKKKNEGEESLLIPRQPATAR